MTAPLRLGSPLPDGVLPVRNPLRRERFSAEGVVTYMLLIVEQPGDRQRAGLEEGQQRYARMLRFAGDLKDRGLLIRTESLTGHAEGVRISKRNGTATMVDGPFAEAKEMIGGFFLLACDTREEAVAIARDCPAAEWATVEVRSLGPCFTDAE